MPSTLDLDILSHQGREKAEALHGKQFYHQHFGCHIRIIHQTLSNLLFSTPSTDECSPVLISTTNHESRIEERYGNNPGNDGLAAA